MFLNWVTMGCFWVWSISVQSAQLAFCIHAEPVSSNIFFFCSLLLELQVLPSLSQSFLIALLINYSIWTLVTSFCLLFILHHLTQTPYNSHLFISTPNPMALDDRAYPLASLLFALLAVALFVISLQVLCFVLWSYLGIGVYNTGIPGLLTGD